MSKLVKNINNNLILSLEDVIIVLLAIGSGDVKQVINPTTWITYIATYAICQESGLCTLLSVPK